jgi:hypothetical protein
MRLQPSDPVEVVTGNHQELVIRQIGALYVPLT